MHFIYKQLVYPIKVSGSVLVVACVTLSAIGVKVHADIPNTSEKQERDVRIGFDALYILPILNISNYLHNSYSADIFANSNIPSVNNFLGTDMRSGCLCTAFMLHSTSLTFKSSISIIQAFQTNEIGYTFTKSFRPFFHLGFGISQVTLIDESNNIIDQSTSSNNLSIIIGVGTDYKIPNTEGTYLYAKLDYIKIFQKVAGDFLKASVGLAYRFFYW